jgi:hypothetical protein
MNVAAQRAVMGIDRPVQGVSRKWFDITQQAGVNLTGSGRQQAAQYQDCKMTI